MVDKTLKREPDELWTGYLLRRLKSDGLGSYRFGKDRHKEMDEARIEVDIDVIEGSEIIITLYRQLVEINSDLDKLSDMSIDGVQNSLSDAKKYSDISALEIEYGLEWREDATIFGDAGDVAVSFFFKESGEVDVVPQSPSFVFFVMPQYMEPQKCKAEDVINDIINFIKKGRGIQDHFEMKGK